MGMNAVGAPPGGGSGRRASGRTHCSPLAALPTTRPSPWSSSTSSLFKLGLSSARLASFDCTLLRSIVVTLVCLMGDAGSGCTISPVAASTFCSLLRLCFTHQGDGSSIYKVYH
ncbi:uncharacterized protein [Aegilops tauschii subsp. strangulata]|uniref:uncharacterized protein isoform X1 n=1 Tax=Aegilops tauschii subsp. strangulata TaxID=200361 RepID=UPI000989B778|nr:uncharacterized protein LOC109735730 isoform X1 [Aegilops tauschii subsp. strangulata]